MPDVNTTRIDFLGLPLNVDASVQSVCALLRDKGKPRLVTFINPGAWALAKRSPEYVKSLHQMTLSLADGQGVAWVCHRLTGIRCSRISFDMTSLADPFFRAAIAERASIMLIGSKPGTDESVHAKLQKHYAELKIIGTHHGYGEFGPKIQDILAHSPDAVIVAMGTPRQEAFLVALRDAGYTGLAITCGGFFDQYLEADPYYPEWIDRWNLRFAYRFYKEPGRLWQRYLIDYPFFVKQAIRALTNKSGDLRLSSSVSK